MVIGDATTGWWKDFLVSAEPVGDRVDIARGGNYSQMLDTEVMISNHTQWFEASEAAGVSLYAAKVEFCSLVYSVTEYAATPLWTGSITDIYPEGGCVRVRVESIVAKIHKEIPTRVITAQEFPGISTDSEGRTVPMIYGSVERLAPPSMKSTQYIPAGYLVSEFGSVDKTLWSVACISASGCDFSAPYVTIYGPSIDELVGAASPESSDYGVQFWPAIPIGGGTLFVEVSSGTGSGQIRRIVTYSKRFLRRGTTATWCAECVVAAPWDTIPDATSTLKFYVLQIAEILIIGDEATVARTYAIEADKEFEIAAAQGIISGVVTSDVSGEFRNGENYSAVSYVAPSENFGSIKLTDKRSDSSIVSNRNTIQILPANHLSARRTEESPCDAFCRTKISCDEFPDGVEEQTKIDCLFSFQSSTIPANTVRMIFIGEELDGTEVVIRDAQTAITGSMSTSFSNYSPAICSDATYGNYSAYTVSIALPKPISAYASFRSCLLLPIEFGPYEQYVYWPSDDTGEYIAGATTIRVINSAAYTIAAGDRIRPFSAFPAAEFSRDILVATLSPGDDAYAGPYSEWRTVQSVTPVSWGYFDVVIDTAFSVPTGTYGVTIVRPDAPFQTISEVEAGFAFVYGEISADSTYIVDLSSGRTSSSVPITMARDAASHLFTSELSTSVDSASFAALQGDAIHSALTERENSADVIARWCEQFNWVISHKGTGDAVAKAPFARVGTELYDHEFDTGAMIEGSISGRDITDVVDIINVPTVSWDYTQADGYRQTAYVSDISADPSTLDASNYLATFSGWGDFAVSLEIYGKLHESFTQYAYRQSGALEYPDAGGDISALLFPTNGISRLDWVASRKIVLPFSVPETLLPSGIVLGSRIKARHKRYTRNAWKYGTLVEWKWDLFGGKFDLKVVLDPTLTSSVPELFVDTIDPSGTVEQYIDQTDGTSEQYTDSIGATA